VHQAKYTKDILKKFKMDDSKPLSTPMSTTTSLDADEDGEPVDQKKYRSMIGSLLYLTRRGWTSNFLCVCALVFRCCQGLHIGRPSSGSSGIFDTLLDSVFGTRLPLPFCFLVFRILTMRGVESIKNRLRVFDSFWDLHLFLGLLANNLV
jgi:hypothetical protein